MVPDIIQEVARELRKNMTKAEKKLWNELRFQKIGERFLRQKPIYVYSENNGGERYVIPDFFCVDKKLIIEVDGSVHSVNEVVILDTHKELILSQKGVKILRFSNEEVIDNIDYVISKIKQEIS